MTILLEERVINHAAYGKVNEVIQALESIDISEITSDDISKIERLSEAFIILKEGFDRVDPWLMSTNTLDNMNNQIANILNGIKTYAKSKNRTYLKNAITYLEAVIPFFPQVMVGRTPAEIEGVREAVISFRKSIGQHTANLEKQSISATEELAENVKQLNNLTASINEQRKRIDSVISDFQDQFLKGQTARNEKNEESIDLKKKEVANLISTIENKHEEEQDKYDKELKLILENNKNIFEEQMKEQEKVFQKEFINIEEMNKEAEKIVGIISMKGLASGYQKIADDEGNKAFWWNVGSIASIISVIVFGVFFILLHDGVMQWATLISRVVLSGFGLTLFTYCARQSSNYRADERRNRKIELELASLDPYLKDLDEQQQLEVKQSLVNKYFGVKLSNLNAPKSQTIDHDFESIISNPDALNVLAEKVAQIQRK